MCSSGCCYIASSLISFSDSESGQNWDMSHKTCGTSTWFAISAVALACARLLRKGAWFKERVRDAGEKGAQEGDGLVMMMMRLKRMFFSRKDGKNL